MIAVLTIQIKPTAITTIAITNNGNHYVSEANGNNDNRDNDNDNDNDSDSDTDNDNDSANDF